MIHIHPFPARMAPEIVLNGLRDIPEDYLVVDPMSGSGMVLGAAAKLGIPAIGFDLDPLACMISRVNGTYVDEAKARRAIDVLLMRSERQAGEDIHLPWIDNDRGTQQYIDFWFAPKQQAQLRKLSYFLVAQPFISDRKILDFLKIIVSRLIVTKEPKASLARDTAHSRPHKVLSKNEFDLFEAIPKSLNHVLSALEPDQIRVDAKSYRGDARKLRRVRSNSIDCIVTSPPYMNAIDYMRGHRLSLVWMGYRVSDLRKLRTRMVGAETSTSVRVDEELKRVLPSLHLELDDRQLRTLRRYYRDLRSLTRESHRILKSGRKATYVVGNSTVKGHTIENANLLQKAAIQAGFLVKDLKTRQIPENRRYLPLKNSEKTSLSSRMREEHVIVLEKAAQ